MLTHDSLEQVPERLCHPRPRRRCSSHISNAGPNTTSLWTPKLGTFSFLFGDLGSNAISKECSLTDQYKPGGKWMAMSKLFFPPTWIKLVIFLPLNLDHKNCNSILDFYVVFKSYNDIKVATSVNNLPVTQKFLASHQSCQPSSSGSSASSRPGRSDRGMYHHHCHKNPHLPSSWLSFSEILKIKQFIRKVLFVCLVGWFRDWEREGEGGGRLGMQLRWRCVCADIVVCSRPLAN